MNLRDRDLIIEQKHERPRQRRPLVVLNKSKAAAG